MFQLFVSQTDGDVSGNLEYHLEPGSGVCPRERDLGVVSIQMALKATGMGEAPGESVVRK